jgi:hypothetical protein
VRRPKTTARPIQRILDLLENVRRGSQGYTALCPAHSDTESSLSVAESEDGRILLKCFAGCEVEEIVEAIGFKLSDLFPAKSRKAAEKPANGDGLTVELYADAKKLPPSFLRKLQLGTVYLQGTPAVSIPYLDRSGEAGAVRFRLSMDAEPRFKWRTGSKLRLYGLWRLNGYTAKYIVLSEGESDCHTLWLHRFPAVGLPGANCWNEKWADQFDRFERIYVLIEPDKGGEAVRKWLANSKIRNRALLINLDGAKDPSELYLADPENFTQAWQAAMKSAIPWSELEDRAKKAQRKSAWQKCKQLARETDILTRFAKALEKRGVAGETRAAKLLYLVLISRFLSTLVSVILAAASSAGKSFVLESVLEFVPRSAYYDLTGLSEKALIYSNEPFAHRFIVLYEAAALNTDFLQYTTRSVLSEGRIRYETVEKTPEGLQSRLVEREGPTGLITTTTAVTINPENDTRYISIPISDSPAQTKRVLLALAKSTNNGQKSQEDSVELEAWLALQQYLELADHEVVIPYATALAELMPPVAVRLRRDFKAILQLTKAHAVLHQATRDRDEEGCIVAKLADYAAIRALVNDLVSEKIEQTVSRTTRETVAAVKEIITKKNQTSRSPVAKDEPTSATIREIAQELGIDRSAATRREKGCLVFGYLQNLETKRGRPHRLTIGDPLPEEDDVMPTAEEVRQQRKKKR